MSVENNFRWLHYAESAAGPKGKHLEAHFAVARDRVKWGLPPFDFWRAHKLDEYEWVEGRPALRSGK